MVTYICTRCGMEQSERAIEQGNAAALGWQLSQERLTALEAEREHVEAVLMDANVTYGYIDTDAGTAGPMMVERQALVKALGYADESAWLARTAEINSARRASGEKQSASDAINVSTSGEAPEGS